MAAHNRDIPAYKTLNIKTRKGREGLKTHKSTPLISTKSKPNLRIIEKEKKKKKIVEAYVR